MTAGKGAGWVGSIRPNNGGDPLRLVARTLRDGGRSGRAAVVQAGLSLAASPIDMVLRPREERLRRTVTTPEQPVIIVVGPPRSGTTIVAQIIARTLGVSHLTNVTAMFPRAPLTAASALRIHPSADRVSTASHYGRTASLADHNDALPLWDQWLGSDRNALNVELSPDQRRAIRTFFAAYEAAYAKPVLAKNNNLVAHAHTIGALLPTAVFLCMTREPMALAQSLVIARRDITNDEMDPYGLHPDRANVDPDVLVDVVRQIEFYNDLAATQQDRLGSARFRLVSYDDFCADPSELVQTLATEVLGENAAPPAAQNLEPLKTSAAERLDPIKLDRLRALLNVARSTS